MASEEFNYELKIPKERVAVLIGKNGEIKKDIENSTGSKLEINSKDGEVIISGDDALSLYTTREIVRAVARGFNPDVAKMLLKQDHSLEIVDIEEYIKSKNDLIRMKGRIIGAEGKSRKTIETLTECYISVYGRTVALIGEVERLMTARKAVERLLGGAPHGNIYKWLEKQNKELRKKEIKDDEGI